MSLRLHRSTYGSAATVGSNNNSNVLTRETPEQIGITHLDDE